MLIQSAPLAPKYALSSLISGSPPPHPPMPAILPRTSEQGGQGGRWNDSRSWVRRTRDEQTMVFEGQNGTS